MPHRSRNFPKNAALGMWGALLADKGYDGDRFRENLLLSNILPVIPPRSNRKVSASPPISTGCSKIRTRTGPRPDPRASPQGANDMPRGTRRELIGILLGDDPYPVLRVADGGEWRLDCSSSCRHLTKIPRLHLDALGRLTRNDVQAVVGKIAGTSLQRLVGGIMRIGGHGASDDIGTAAYCCEMGVKCNRSVGLSERGAATEGELWQEDRPNDRPNCHSIAHQAVLKVKHKGWKNGYSWANVSIREPARRIGQNCGSERRIPHSD